MDAFISVSAGTLPAEEFFAPENVSRILGAVRDRGGACVL